jgi:hypothetical protein
MKPHLNEHKCWFSLWKAKVPAKIRTFLWRLPHQSLTTGSTLHNRKKGRIHLLVHCAIHHRIPGGIPSFSVTWIRTSPGKQSRQRQRMALLLAIIIIAWGFCSGHSDALGHLFGTTKGNPETNFSQPAHYHGFCPCLLDVPKKTGPLVIINRNTTGVPWVAPSQVADLGQNRWGCQAYFFSN